MMVSFPQGIHSQTIARDRSKNVPATIGAHPDDLLLEIGRTCGSQMGNRQFLSNHSAFALTGKIWKACTHQVKWRNLAV
jgi:hypothetical protein